MTCCASSGCNTGSWFDSQPARSPVSVCACTCQSYMSWMGFGHVQVLDREFNLCFSFLALQSGEIMNGEPSGVPWLVNQMCTCSEKSLESSLQLHTLGLKTLLIKLIYITVRVEVQSSGLDESLLASQYHFSWLSQSLPVATWGTYRLQSTLGSFVVTGTS